VPQKTPGGGYSKVFIHEEILYGIGIRWFEIQEEGKRNVGLLRTYPPALPKWEGSLLSVGIGFSPLGDCAACPSVAEWQTGEGSSVRIDPCQSKTLRLRSGQASSPVNKSKKKNYSVLGSYGAI
jgi:hypothetical protein